MATVALGQRDSAYTKRSDRYLAILAGYNGIKRQFLEAGVAVHRYKVIDGHHAAGTATFVSTEVMIDKYPTVGPKVGAWISGDLMVFGANAIYYMNKEGNSVRLRPEVGLGASIFKLVYGYNFAITNTDFDRINTHNFSVVVLFPVKKLKYKISLL